MLTKRCYKRPYRASKLPCLFPCGAPSWGEQHDPNLRYLCKDAHKMCRLRFGIYLSLCSGFWIHNVEFESQVSVTQPNIRMALHATQQGI